MIEITRNYFGEKAAGWINESYDQGQTIAHTRLSAVLKLIRGYGAESILDVGCGDGRLLQQLGAVKVRAGIDYSNRMIEMATALGDAAQFTQVDLNVASDLKKLEKVGRFDLITMMGVIHYLAQPSEAIKGLRACAHDGSRLLVSFRNRLLNIQATSQYFQSPLNQANLRRLEGEVDMWGRVGLAPESFVQALGNDDAGHQLVDAARDSKSFEGVTDNHWNPEHFEHWRQFTPLDAVVLMSKAGFQAERIVPLINKSVKDDVLKSTGAEAVPGAWEVANCSSFIVVAKFQAVADA